MNTPLQHRVRSPFFLSTAVLDAVDDNGGLIIHDICSFKGCVVALESNARHNQVNRHDGGGR